MQTSTERMSFERGNGSGVKRGGPCAGKREEKRKEEGPDAGKQDAF